MKTPCFMLTFYKFGLVLELDTRGPANYSIANKCVSDEFNYAKLPSTSLSKRTQRW